MPSRPQRALREERPEAVARAFDDGERSIEAVDESARGRRDGNRGQFDRQGARDRLRRDDRRDRVLDDIAGLQRLRVEQADEAIGDGLRPRGGRRKRTGDGEERDERRGPDDASHGDGDGLHAAPPYA
jgi:hypothetical protein